MQPRPAFVKNARKHNILYGAARLSCGRSHHTQNKKNPAHAVKPPDLLCDQASIRKQPPAGAQVRECAGRTSLWRRQPIPSPAGNGLEIQEGGSGRCRSGAFRGRPVMKPRDLENANRSLRREGRNCRRASGCRQVRPDFCFGQEPQVGMGAGRRQSRCDPDSSPGLSRSIA